MEIKNLLDIIDSFYKEAELYSKFWGPYNRSNDPKDKRKIVIVLDEEGKKRTISYPKFLMEQHLNKKLEDGETVDHINNDIDNNNLDNLRVLDRAEHSALDTRRVKNLKLNCAICGKEFERSPRLLRDKSKKGKPSVFCSRQCAGIYSRKVQLGQMDKIPPSDYVPSEYYKNKHLETTAELFAIKYAGLI